MYFTVFFCLILYKEEFVTQNFIKVFFFFTGALIFVLNMNGCSQDIFTYVLIQNEETFLLLDPSLDWYGTNRQQLDQMILTYGKFGGNYLADQPPVAVFDFDNTCIKNDIGNMVTYWMLNNNLIYQPPGYNWSFFNSLLTIDAIMALNTACDNQGLPGTLMTTDLNDVASRACANEIITIYNEGKTTGCLPAFIQDSDHYIDPTYAFIVQLQGGHTQEEIREIAETAIDCALYNPEGSTQMVGNSSGFSAYIRRYEQIENLIELMQEHGFHVWIVSASSQYVIEAFATHFGVSEDQVIGVRAGVDNTGRLTYRFQGVGTFPDDNNAIISYRDGKRWWINKEIFNIEDPLEQTFETDTLTNRLIFVAGDSNTDISMLLDAQYKLVINRNETELMCYAYYNEDSLGNWLINPMFIDPKFQKTEGYSCSLFGLPDQQDSIYGE